MNVLNKEMDQRRKLGVKMIKTRLSAIVEDEDLALAAKVDKLNDEEAFAKMTDLMQ